MNSRFVMPFQQWMDGNGSPLSGAKLYFYVSGTTTPLDTYSDALLTTPNPNPVVADANGVWPSIFLSNNEYKAILTTSADVQVWSADPVVANPPLSTQSIADYGASVDDDPDELRTKIQAAIDATAGVAILTFPPGEWEINGSLTFPSDSYWVGAGKDVTIIRLVSPADEDDAVVRPATYDGDIERFVIMDMTLDGNAGGRGITGVGTNRPGGSCLSTNGAKHVNAVRCNFINAVLHGVDVCNGGEMEGGQRYYVAPSNLDGEYYPDNGSEFVFVEDCEASGAGDDAMSGHYSRYLWITRPYVHDASNRHPTPYACNGVEIDDGMRDFWVIDGFAERVTRAFVAKSHPDNPSCVNGWFINPKARGCNSGVYVHRPNGTEIGGNIWVVNPDVQEPAEFVSGSDAALIGIEVSGMRGVHILNPIVMAPDDTALSLSNAIQVGNSCDKVNIIGGHLKNWPKNETSVGTNAGLYVTSTCDHAAISGITVENCGYRAVVSTQATEGQSFKANNLTIIGEDVANSVGLQCTGVPITVRIDVSGLSVSGYPEATRYGSARSYKPQTIFSGGYIWVPGTMERETAALVQAMTTPSDKDRTHIIDDLIVALKDAGVWTKLDFLYVMAAHDQQAARLNWRWPGRWTLTENGSPTFTADEGYTGDGGGAYLDTGFNPSTAGGNWALNSAHIGVWSGTNVAASTYDIGLVSGNLARICPRSATDNYVARLNDVTTLSISGSSTSVGHTVANRSGASARQIYKNGSSVGSDTTASTTLPSTNVVLLRDASTYSTRQIRVAHGGASLSSAEVSDLYSALNTYLGAI